MVFRTSLGFLQNPLLRHALYSVLSSFCLTKARSAVATRTMKKLVSLSPGLLIRRIVAMTRMLAPRLVATFHPVTALPAILRLIINASLMYPNARRVQVLRMSSLMVLVILVPYAYLAAMLRFLNSAF